MLGITHTANKMDRELLIRTLLEAIVVGLLAIFVHLLKQFVIQSGVLDYHKKIVRT